MESSKQAAFSRLFQRFVSNGVVLSPDYRTNIETGMAYFASERQMLKLIDNISTLYRGGITSPFGLSPDMFFTHVLMSGKYTLFLNGDL